MNQEQALISSIKSITQSKYIGDDCAVIDFNGEKLLFSVDSFVEHTHFKQDYFTPCDIGWKSMAVSISDIIAMRGQALYALVAINLSNKISDKAEWIKNFYQGMQNCADRFDQVKIIGGDLCCDISHTSISVTIIGKALSPLYRSGAMPGDVVSISGKSGNSASYLKFRNDIDKPYHLRPCPRTDLRDVLLSLDRGALMDTSDGLAQALMEIAIQSKVDIELDFASIPRDAHVDLELALYGGEDYQLLLASNSAPEGFYPIARAIAQSDKPRIIGTNGLELLVDKVFNHFN